MPEPLKGMPVVLISSVSFAKPVETGEKVTLNENEAPAASVLGRAGTPETEYGLLTPSTAMFDTTAGSVPVFVMVKGIVAVLVT